MIRMRPGRSPDTGTLRHVSRRQCCWSHPGAHGLRSCRAWSGRRCRRPSSGGRAVDPCEGARGQRPCVRAVFVVAQLLSMNTSSRASGSVRPWHQSCRRFRPWAWSRSLAHPVPPFASGRGGGKTAGACRSRSRVRHGRRAASRRSRPALPPAAREPARPAPDAGGAAVAAGPAGRASPRLRSRLTLAASMPGSTAAARCPAPSATAPRTRRREPADSILSTSAGFLSGPKSRAETAARSESPCGSPGMLLQRKVDAGAGGPVREVAGGRRRCCAGRRAGARARGCRG